MPIDWRIVSPGYFKCVGIPLLQGRDFAEADDPTAFTIVCVVGDVRSTALTQDSLALYHPMASRVWPLMDIAHDG